MDRERRQTATSRTSGMRPRSPRGGRHGVCIAWQVSWLPDHPRASPSRTMSSGFARRCPRLQWRGRAGLSPASLFRIGAAANPGRCPSIGVPGQRPRNGQLQGVVGDRVRRTILGVNKSFRADGSLSKVGGLVAKLRGYLEPLQRESRSESLGFRVSEQHEWAYASTTRASRLGNRNQRSVRDAPESRQGRDG